MIYQDATFKICLSLFGWKVNILDKMHIVQCTTSSASSTSTPPAGELKKKRKKKSKGNKKRRFEALLAFHQRLVDENLSVSDFELMNKHITGLKVRLKS